MTIQNGMLVLCQKRGGSVIVGIVGDAVMNSDFRGDPAERFSIAGTTLQGWRRDGVIKSGQRLTVLPINRKAMWIKGFKYSLARKLLPLVITEGLE